MVMLLFIWYEQPVYALSKNTVVLALFNNVEQYVLPKSYGCVGVIYIRVRFGYLLLGVIKFRNVNQ